MRYLNWTKEKEEPHLKYKKRVDRKEGRFPERVTLGYILPTRPLSRYCAWTGHGKHYFPSFTAIRKVSNIYCSRMDRPLTLLQKSKFTTAPCRDMHPPTSTPRKLFTLLQPFNDMFAKEKEWRLSLTVATDQVGTRRLSCSLRQAVEGDVAFKCVVHVLWTDNREKRCGIDFERYSYCGVCRRTEGGGGVTLLPGRVLTLRTKQWEREGATWTAWIMLAHVGWSRRTMVTRIQIFRPQEQVTGLRISNQLVQPFVNWIFVLLLFHVEICRKNAKLQK